MLSKYKLAVIDLRDRLPRLTIIVIVTLLVQIIIVFGVLVFFDRFTGPTNNRDRFVDSVQTTQKFKPGQALTVRMATVTVYVPPFAIPLPGTIFVSAADGSLYPSTDHPEWSRPQVVDVQFQNLEGRAIPEIVLSVPLKICFKLTKTEWQKYAGRPGSFAIQYYGLKKGQPVWLNLPVAKHPDLFELCAQTEHLSLFALALKSDPNIPVTGSTATPEPTEPPTQPSPLSVNVPSASTRERNKEPSTIAQQPTSVTPAYLPPQMSTNISQSAATPTRTPRPTATQRPTSTPTRRPTSTPTQRPTSTATRRPTSTATQRPTPTSIISQSTATRPPTPTNPPPTNPPTPTRPAPTPTSPPPTNPPTPTRPPPTSPPPTNPPTPTRPPPTSPPPTNPPTPTSPPPTSPPPTDPPPTNPPPTDPPPTDPPPTDPPPTDPPPTDPPPTDPPPTDPPPTDPPPTP